MPSNNQDKHERKASQVPDPANKMTKSAQEGRAQPWKGHWPPAKETEVGVAYGFKKGDKVSIYGN
jgi:hypothetical protein